MQSILGNRNLKVVWTLFCVQLFLSGCGVDKVRVYQVPREGVQTSSSKMEQKSFDSLGEDSVEGEAELVSKRELTWTLPEAWKQELGSGMKLASIEPVNAPEVKITIVSLNGNGGGLLSNLNRWRGQLGIQPITSNEIENDQVDFFFCSIGQVRLFKIISESKGFLIGVISLKSKTVFVKLSAPSENLDMFKDKLTSLLKSFRRVK